MRSGGWFLIFAALLAVLAGGIGKGLRISETIMAPGQLMGPEFGYAAQDPDARTLFCRYLTWSGIEERVYRYRYSDTYAGSYCPFLLEKPAQ